MTRLRPTVWHRAITLATAAATIALITGCTDPGKPKDDTGDEELFGTCFNAFGTKVLATSLNADGSLMVYLTSSKPESVADDQWASGDRALVMQDMTTNRSQDFVLTWPAPADNQVPVWATANPTAEATARPYTFTEQMINMQMAPTGGRFVVAVRRAGVEGLIAKLYTGIVPATVDTETLLEPGNGLEVIPINDFQATEGIRSYDLSPDGNMLAAVVGNNGEVRVWDFTKQEMSVYTQGPKNTVVVTHELPKRSSVSTDTDRQPAVANQGTMLVRWSPQGDRLLIATDVPINDSALGIMNPVDGKLTPVRRFRESTVPQAAWSKDGKSLYVMTTELKSGPVFGNTAIRHIAAADGGKDVSKGGQLVQQPGFTTEPANLVNFGDDQHFLFNWQNGLWRLTATGDDLTQAQAEKVSPPSNASVPYLPSSVSSTADKAVFVAGSGGAQYATVRDGVSSDKCAAGEAGELPTGTPDAAGASGTPAAATPVPTP
jgi:WD40 repeat protein